jgi:hypothetical protein
LVKNCFGEPAGSNPVRKISSAIKHGSLTDRSYNHPKSPNQKALKLNNFALSTVGELRHINSVSNINMTSTSRDKAHGSSLNLKRKSSASSIKKNSKKIESYLTTLANASSGGVKLTTFAKNQNKLEQNSSNPIYEKPTKFTQHKLNEYYRKASTPSNIYSATKNYPTNLHQKTTNSSKPSKKNFNLKTEIAPLATSNLLKSSNYMNLDNSNSLMMTNRDRDFQLVPTIKSSASISGKLQTDRNNYSNSFVKKGIGLDVRGLVCGNSFRMQTEPQTTREHYGSVREKSQGLEFSAGGRQTVYKENSKLGGVGLKQGGGSIGNLKVSPEKRAGVRDTSTSLKKKFHIITDYSAFDKKDSKGHLWSGSFTARNSNPVRNSSVANVTAKKPLLGKISRQDLTENLDSMDPVLKKKNSTNSIKGSAVNQKSDSAKINSYLYSKNPSKDKNREKSNSNPKEPAPALETGDFKFNTDNL